MESTSANVMLVDDEQQIRDLCVRHLSAYGYRCETAPDAGTARQRLEQKRFDLILCDINLPDESGLHLAEYVKHAFPDTAIVMISAIDDPGEAKLALDIGVFGYVVKPFTRNTLLINVENALQRNRLESEKKAYLDKLESLVRKRTRSLNAQLLLLQNTIDAIPSPVFYKDAAGCFKGCNAAFESLTGTPRKAIIGRTVAEIAPQAPSELSMETDRLLLADPGKLSYGIVITDKDNRLRNFLLNKATYRDTAGKVAGLVGVMVDITEKLALERELHQAQQLESIGQLAAGIAHEINTPTQYIGDNTRFLQDAFADLVTVLDAYGQLLAAVKGGGAQQEDVHEVERQLQSVDLDYLRSEIPLAIEQALDGVSRVSRIITAMRQFSHPGTDKKSPVDINRALEATITIARNEWKYVADLETDLDPALPPVACLPGEINQVFLNLLVNAAHAIGESTDDGRKGKGVIRVGTRRNDGAVQIRIADTGGGIPTAVQPRIFDPFFTTKPVGKGTGQGLAIAHAVIVEKHAGTIRYETDNGRGTTFIIDLPIGCGDSQGPTDDA